MDWTDIAALLELHEALGVLISTWRTYDSEQRRRWLAIAAGDRVALRLLRARPALGHLFARPSDKRR